MLIFPFVIEAIAEQLKELQRTLNRNITQVSVFKEMYAQIENQFDRKQIIIGRTPVMWKLFLS